MTDYNSVIYVGQTPLQVNDTVTSFLKYYQMKLRSTGLTLTFHTTPQSPQWLVSVPGVSSAKLANTQFLIVLNPPPPLSFPIPFNAYALEVQDNGQVVVYDQAGDMSCVLFSYTQALVAVSGAALASVEEALGNAKTKFDALKQTVRQLSPDLLDRLDHKEPPQQSGFPGPSDAAEAEENVA
jgi:hypothetical protein